jgi:hypothetical protein
MYMKQEKEAAETTFVQKIRFLTVDEIACW